LSVLPDKALRPVSVDRLQLESALFSVILNARDAMPESGAITVETQRIGMPNDTDTDPMGLPVGRYVAISVGDSGPGMSPEVAARASEPFFSSKAAGCGAGLGPAMVQQFARHAGGAVSLSCAPGGRTSVHIVSPGDVRDAAVCPRNVKAGSVSQGDH
jgi:signal transduction histidine kinase